MLAACRTEGDGFAIPTFDVLPSDVEGFMDELRTFQAVFHDCFSRREPREHFFDYMVGQFSPLERKSIEPMALKVADGNIRGMQRLISDVVWDEDQMRWHYHHGSCWIPGSWSWRCRTTRFLSSSRPKSPYFSRALKMTLRASGNFEA